MASSNHENIIDKPTFAVFIEHRWLFLITVVVIFLIGLGIRFYDLTDAPLDFHPTRQLYSAIKARGMFYQKSETVPQWQKDYAVEQWNRQGLIEPPVLERLSAYAYQIAGREILWIPRIFSILFWFLGGIALLFLAKEIIDENGAVFALMLYMLTPYTAEASRSFQPDPLMVCLIIFALWNLVRWSRSKKWSAAILTGIFAGLAIFIKSVAIFPLAAALIIVVLMSSGFPGFLRNRQVWVMALLTIVPYLLYHIYGVYIIGDLQSQFSLRFFPQLWSDPAFWLQWNGMISKVVGLEFFLAAIVGTFLLKDKRDRALMISLFVGYFIYGLTLSHHISTHDYYQLPLVPVVSLGAAAVFSSVIKVAKGKQWVLITVILATLGYYTAIKAWDVRVDLKRTNYENEVLFWTRMGDVFQPEDLVVGITQDYGYRFEYWGWHKIENWMSSADFALRELSGQSIDMQSWFEEQVAGKDYFLVTQPAELDRQPKIKQLLNDNYPVWQQTDDYIIYDLQNSIKD
jgi:4-amino-4-deoxy-L-arabinose transferase-like glycosyltransferase